MRQIEIGAWLLVISSLATACGGDQFTSGGQADAATSGASNGQSPGSPPSAGQANEDEVTSGAGGSASTGGSGRGGSASNLAGAKASGGTAASGNGTGASSGVGGAATEECVLGSVKIRMVPSGDLPEQYLCDAGCGTGWLTITNANGAAAFSLFPGCGTISCDSCSATPCAAAACLPTPLSASGNELTWTGQYLTHDTCGMSQACERPACVAPGKYKAKACAALNGGSNDLAGSCMPKSEMLCAETEFEFPSDTEVKLVLKK